jgi:hypothetical protein
LVRAFSERGSDEAWRSRGACRRQDPETFFPAPSETPEIALALCRGCDVQGACLAWALDAGDCHGVWGATTPRERRAMAVVWRGDTPAETLPGALGDVVILPMQRAQLIDAPMRSACREAPSTLPMGSDAPMLPLGRAVPVAS